MKSMATVHKIIERFSNTSLDSPATLIPQLKEFLAKIEFDKSFEAPVFNKKDLFIPQTSRKISESCLQKRPFSIAFNRDFFYNKDKHIILRNRYLRTFEHSIDQNKHFVYKRKKGKSLIGE